MAQRRTATSIGGPQRWSDAKRGKVHEPLVAVVRQLEQRQAARRSRDLHHLRLYADKQYWSAHPALSALWSAATEGLTGGGTRPKLGLNVIRSCVLTATAKICTNRPRVVFLTEDGAWDEQRKAKRRQKFIDALFDQEQAYRYGERAHTVGGILGTGAVRVVREHGAIRLEPTFVSELLVDDVEAIYGEPRQLFHARLIDRHRLEALYPSKASEIRAHAEPATRHRRDSVTRDMVQVFEAWELPSRPDSADGRYVACVPGVDLADTEYRHDAFPYGFFRWNDEPLGFWGTGIAEELSGIQYEINQLVRVAQWGMYHASVPRVLIERNSDIVSTEINNDLRAPIVHYRGTPPQWVVPNGANDQLLHQLQWLIQQAYALVGISAMSARAEMPAALAGASGRSKLIHQNIESERFAMQQRRYEQLYVELAQRVLEAASDLDEDGAEMKVQYARAGWLETITYKDIKVDAGHEPRLQAIPTSMLPHTPAGKMMMADMWEAKGWITPAKAKQLSGFADLQDGIETAPETLLDERIGKMLDEGIYLSPHPFMDLKEGIKRAATAIQYAELHGAPEERIDLVRQFHAACVDLLDPAPAAAAATAPPALPPVPGGGLAGAVASPPSSPAGAPPGALMQ